MNAKTKPFPSAPASAAGACSHHEGGAPPRDAFEILLACHRHVLSVCDTLEQVAAAVSLSATLDEASLARLATALATLDTAIPIHSADEEQSLFPALRAHPPFAGGAGTPMDCMEHEHGTHRTVLAALKRALMRGAAAEVARNARVLAGDYRDHIAKEEQVLLPMARRLLDAATVRRLTAEMLARRAALGVTTC